MDEFQEKLDALVAEAQADDLPESEIAEALISKAEAIRDGITVEEDILGADDEP